MSKKLHDSNQPFTNDPFSTFSKQDSEVIFLFLELDLRFHLSHSPHKTHCNKDKFTKSIFRIQQILDLVQYVLSLLNFEIRG